MGQAKRRKEAESRRDVEGIAALAQSLTIFVNPAVRAAVAERMVRKGLVRICES